MNNSKSLKVIELKQQGFSLIELMVAITIGLLIIATIISVFVTILSINKNNLTATRLRQDLNSTMSLMARNIRRAGAWTWSGNPETILDVNLFRNITIEDVGTNTDACITFSYDKNKNGAFDNDERLGYRLDTTEKAVEIRKNGGLCDSSNWENITDEKLIEITGLKFLRPEENTITIELAGRLKKDNQVTRNIENTITIRNWTP